MDEFESTLFKSIEPRLYQETENFKWLDIKSVLVDLVFLVSYFLISADSMTDVLVLACVILAGLYTKSPITFDSISFNNIIDDLKNEEPDRQIRGIISTYSTMYEELFDAQVLKAKRLKIQIYSAVAGLFLIVLL